MDRNNLTLNIIDFYDSHNSIVSLCYKTREHLLEDPNNIVTISFEKCKFCYPDHALLILCSIKHLDSIGINTNSRLNIIGDTTVTNYLNRMGFFKNISGTLPLDIVNGNTQNLVEIQSYNDENHVQVLNSIMHVLRSNTNIDENVYTCLDYCLNEILDNVLIHSDLNEGWVVMQHYPNMNSIRLIVTDRGIGIHKSLSSSEIYADLDEEECILQCIQEGITRGTGQGHGLYATSQFALLNKGCLTIISGNKALDVKNDNNTINTISHWQGTCIYLRINTNIEVDYRAFTSTNYDYKEALFEGLFD